MNDDNTYIKFKNGSEIRCIHSDDNDVKRSSRCDDMIKKKTYNYLTDKYIVAWGRIE